MYENGIYGDENAWGLYRYAEQQKLSPKCISNYLDSIITSKNVIRILFDAMLRSVGDQGYGYRLEKTHLDIMDLAHVSKLENILKHVIPANASQKRIHTAYKNYLNGNNEAIYYDDPIEPDEL